MNIMLFILIMLALLFMLDNIVQNNNELVGGEVVNSARIAGIVLQISIIILV